MTIRKEISLNVGMILISVSDTGLEVNFPRNEDKKMGKKYFRGHVLYILLVLQVKNFVWSDCSFYS